LRSSDKSDPLYLWVTQLVLRRGKQIAVVALARRLIGVLWAIGRGIPWKAPSTRVPRAVIVQRKRLWTANSIRAILNELARLARVA